MTSRSAKPTAADRQRAHDDRPRKGVVGLPAALRTGQPTDPNLKSRAILQAKYRKVAAMAAPSWMIAVYAVTTLASTGSPATTPRS